MKRILPNIRFNVYSKIIIPFLLVIILGLMTTIPYGIRITNRLNTEKADNSLISVSEVAINYIETRMDELLAYVQSTIHNDSIKKAISNQDSVKLIKYLLPLKVRLKISFMAVLDTSGKRIVGLGNEQIIDELDQLDIIPKVITGINIKSLNTTADDILLIAASPNETAEEGVDGLLLAGILIDDEFLTYMAKLVDHPVALMSPDNRIIEASDPALAEQIRSALLSFREEKPLLLDLSIRDKPYRALSRNIMLYNQVRANILLATPMTDIIAFRNKILKYILTMALASVVVVLIMGVILARNITNPIRNLLSLTKEVGRGNLESQIDKYPGDELGDLSISFNQMVKGLKSSMMEIQSSRSKIAKYAHELEHYSAELQRDKKETEAILLNIRDGLIMIDLEGAVSAINPEALKILEINRKKCLGRDIRKVIEPFLERLANPDRMLRIIRFAGAHSIYEESHELVVQKPHKMVYRVQMNPVFDEEKNLLGWILIWTNITIEKETEEMKNNFLATISHELRTPLTSIRGALNLLLDGNLGHLSQDQREFLKIANYNSERLTSLVNNILDIARVEAGQFWAKKISCDLISLIRKSLEAIKSLALKHNAKLQFESEIKSAPIKADPERINQLISNLVDNAIKFSPDGSQVTMRLNEIQHDENNPYSSNMYDLISGTYYLVQISDKGEGIAKDQIEKIFEKFYQADMTSTRRAGGSGLGLAIVKTIATEHGGTVWAENRPKGGSRFSFVLPRTELSDKTKIREL